MRILFCIPAVPVASNYSGASSRVIQSFYALETLCNEVHVARLSTEKSLVPTLAFESKSSEAKAARNTASSWTEIILRPSLKIPQRLRNAFRSLCDPVGLTFPDVDAAARELRPVVERVRPDVIWVETTEVAATVFRMRASIPWLLSQQDWLYRVCYFRWGSQVAVKDRWLLHVYRRAERQIYRSASVALSCSLTDVQRLRGVGCRKAYWIPYSYDPRPSLPEDARPAPDFRITHFGSMETTSNRVGMEAYLRKAHRNVVAACHKLGVNPELWIYGDASTAKEPLATQLREFGAVLKGHVTDFDATFRPFDVSIIPYEYDTGFRSKMPLLFSYGQVVVATRASLLGSWVNGLDQVCRVLDRLEEFPAAIADLAARPDKRERLGRAAHDFFNHHFIHERVLPQYSHVLGALRSS